MHVGLFLMTLFCFNERNYNNIIYTFFLVCRIHDRKISVLGLCAVLQCPLRPAPVLKLAANIIPAITNQLDALVDAYKCMGVCVCVCVRV